MSNKSDTSKPGTMSWQINARETLYDGFYKIESIRFEHDLFTGGSTAELQRELFVRGNVTGVLPYDRVNDTVALVQQFRIGALHQTTGPWLLEIIAGMIESNEKPEQVAIREAHEEAGIVLSEVQLISHYLASPGASTEEVFVFFSETDLSHIGGTHGLPEEDEDILVKVVPADVAIEMMETRKIRNALSIIALQWLKNHRAG